MCCKFTFLFTSVYFFVCFFFFLMLRRPPRSTRTDTSFPTRRSSDLSNRKTVSSGTNDEAIPVEQSVTARDRPRLALKRLVTAAIQTVGLMNRLALARNVHNAHHVHMGCCASDRNATPDA